MIPIEADAEQIAVESNSVSATWHFERGERTLALTIRYPSARRSCEWLTWSEGLQDWIGTAVPVAQVEDLIPNPLYS